MSTAGRPAVSPGSEDRRETRRLALPPRAFRSAAAWLVALLATPGLAAAGPHVASLHERFSVPDGTPWPRGWTIESDRGGALVDGGRGRLSTSPTGPHLGPFVRARSRAAFTAVDLSLRATHVTGTTPLQVVAFAGSPGQVTLSLDVTGWYTVRSGARVLVDATRVGNRPRDAGPGRDFRVRLLVQHHGDATDLYVKRWAAAEAEPGVWNHARFRDPDPALRAADGPLQLQVDARGATWLVDDLSARVPRPAQQPRRRRPPGGIDATGDLHIPADGTDVSLILPQALATVPAGSVVHLDPGRRYGIEQPLRIFGLEHVRIEGHGARLVRSGAGVRGPHVQLDGCADVTLAHLEIAGNAAGYRYDHSTEFDAGIAINRSRDVVLTDLSVHHVGGDAVQAQGGTERLTVRRLHAHHIGRQGVSFNDGDGFLLEDAHFEWIGRSVVDVEPYTPAWATRNVVLRRNFATHFTNFFLAAAGAGVHEGLSLEDNVVRGGLGLATIGAARRGKDGVVVPIPAERVRIERNDYDFRDPEIVQTRNLASLAVTASDEVVVVDNAFSFLCEDQVSVTAPAAIIRGNTVAGVDRGLRVNTGSQGCPIVADNVVTSRTGAPANVELIPPASCQAEAPSPGGASTGAYPSRE